MLFFIIKTEINAKVNQCLQLRKKVSIFAKKYFQRNLKFFLLEAQESLKCITLSYDWGLCLSIMKTLHTSNSKLELA